MIQEIDSSAHKGWVFFGIMAKILEIAHSDRIVQIMGGIFWSFMLQFRPFLVLGLMT